MGEKENINKHKLETDKLSSGSNNEEIILEAAEMEHEEIKEEVEHEEIKEEVAREDTKVVGEKQDDIKEEEIVDEKTEEDVNKSPELEPKSKSRCSRLVKYIAINVVIVLLHMWLYNYVVVTGKFMKDFGEYIHYGDKFLPFWRAFGGKLLMGVIIIYATIFVYNVWHIIYGKTPENLAKLETAAEKGRQMLIIEKERKWSNRIWKLIRFVIANVVSVFIVIKVYNYIITGELVNDFGYNLNEEAIDIFWAPIWEAVKDEVLFVVTTSYIIYFPVQFIRILLGKTSLETRLRIEEKRKKRREKMEASKIVKTVKIISTILTCSVIGLVIWYGVNYGVGADVPGAVKGDEKAEEGVMITIVGNKNRGNNEERVVFEFCNNYKVLGPYMRLNTRALNEKGINTKEFMPKEMGIVDGGLKEGLKDRFLGEEQYAITLIVPQVPKYDYPDTVAIHEKRRWYASEQGHDYINFTDGIIEITKLERPLIRLIKNNYAVYEELTSK